MVQMGLRYGYLLNAAKSVLVVKPYFLDEALQIFEGSGVSIEREGCRYLGADIGSSTFYLHLFTAETGRVV